MLEKSGSQPLLESPSQSPETTESTSDIPQASAEFRNLPHNAEVFGTVPQAAERKETHTLTVRETARMFEAAGVARTERSIINWCQPNRQGIARLDSYHDPNERKYYITPQSVETAIQEELQRVKKSTNVPASELFGNSVEAMKHTADAVSTIVGDGRKVMELEREIRDLKITNRAKDMFIEQLKEERSGFFDKLLLANRTVGQLENKSQGLGQKKNLK